MFLKKQKISNSAMLLLSTAISLILDTLFYFIFYYSTICGTGTGATPNKINQWQYKQLKKFHSKRDK